MKKYLIYAVIIFVIILVMRKKVSKTDTTEESGSNDWGGRVQPTPAEIKDALNAVIKKFGKDIADSVERIYRLETGHFTANIYKRTFSAGMVKLKENFPYGWSSPRKIWDASPELAPVGTYKSVNGLTYIVFPNVKAGMFSLAEYLRVHNNDVPRWNSLDPTEQKIYADKISKINPKIVSSLT